MKDIVGSDCNEVEVGMYSQSFQVLNLPRGTNCIPWEHTFMLHLFSLSFTFHDFGPVFSFFPKNFLSFDQRDHVEEVDE